jgi:hypothetical protein
MKLTFIHGIILGAIIALFFLIDGCKSRKDFKVAVTQRMEYQHKAEEYKTKNGTLVAKNERLKTTMEVLKSTNDSLVGYIKEIGVKNPKTITIIETETKLKGVKIPIRIYDCDVDTAFTKEDKHYMIYGKLNSSGLYFDSLSFPNKLGLVLGYQRPKWFKRKEPVVTVTNSNPYVRVQGITSIDIIDKKKFYERTWFKLTAGAVIGATAVIMLKK